LSGLNIFLLFASTMSTSLSKEKIIE